MTSKELGYLEDTIKSEQQLVKKYQTYAAQITDVNLKSLCEKAAKKHDNHYKTLLSNLNM